MKTDRALNLKSFGLFCVFGISGVFLVLYGISKYGPGVTHDSAAYIYAAKSLLAGKGYVYFGYGTPFIQWPPLYPTLLAAAGGWVFNPVHAAGYINAAVFGFIIVLCGMWMRGNMESAYFPVLGTLSILFSIPLIQISLFAWSETLFILFLLLFLVKLSAFAKTQSCSTLVAAAVFAALACLTRYAGITAIGTGLFMLLIQHKKFSKKLAEMVVFGSIACVPFGIWVIRNYIVSSTFLGTRTPSVTSLGQNIRLTLATVLSWFTPFGGYVALGKAVTLAFAALTFLILCLLVIFFVTFLFHSRRNLRGMGSAAGTGSKYSIIVPLAVFSALYTAYLIASATSVAFDAINTRLLSPICIPIVLFAFFAADMAVSGLRKGSGSKLALWLAVALAVIWSVGPGVLSLPALKTLAENGAGVYASKPWQDSETVGYLKKNALEGKIYSNYPDAVFLLTGRDAKYMPRKSGPAEYGFDRFKQSVRQGEKSYIVWFNGATAGTIYNVDDLRRYFNIKEVARTSDGSVFSLE